MFFEAKHSLSENEFYISSGEFINFPQHLHRSFEYFEQKCGSTEVMIEGKSYILNAGEAVLIFPLQSHSYRCIATGAMKICIFSPEVAANFNAAKANLIPKDNRFRCNLPDGLPTDGIYHKKSLAYFICGEFDSSREYTARAYKNEDKIFTELLLFADKHFNSGCLLRDAAANIGYDYAYASKLFKRRAGISFRQYVNNIRIIECKQLLVSTHKSIEEIGEICGFGSLRAFDREFKTQTGISPSEFRQINSKINKG
jgi:AraC-like DNA-binding protein/quercetin dioxygenase-like cupin family protein